MTPARPIARDLAASTVSPVAVARWTHTLEHAPSRPITHSHAALVFSLGGRSRVELRSEWDLRPGDCMLVPAGEPHRMLSARSTDFWGLGLCAPCFAADGAVTLLEPFERVRDGASAIVHIPDDRHTYLARLFEELQNVAPSRTDAAVQRSLVTLILAEVARASTWEVPASVRGTSVVAAALRFIERNCLRSLTLDEVAAAVGRSPAHVTTALSRATGRSAGQWIVSGRMAEARRLLLHSDENVDAVAERVGYADTTHFIRMFRREHQATPAAWRAVHARARRD